MKHPKIPLVFVCLCAVLLLLASGCFHKKPQPEKPAHSLVRLEPDHYPLFSDDLFYDGIHQAIEQSLIYYNKIPKNRRFYFAGDVYDTSHLIRSLEFFKVYIQSEPSGENLNAFIREHFAVYQSTGKDGDGEVLYTGYYEPSLNGSLTRSDTYRYPVYAQPVDLVSINLRLFSDDKAFRRTIMGRYTGENSVVPYYERSQIGDGDILSDTAKPLAFVDDKIDLFFLEIQGSGIIHLDNGEDLRVHYHTKNGHPYRSIGTYLIRSGKMESEGMSMQKIREYLHQNPGEVEEVLNYNPSYVFFIPEEGGPYGCYAVEVTPERSIATDKRAFPACAMAFVATEKPLIDGDGHIMEWIPFGRFVMNQDTGGAIRGPGRADLFKGNGRYAEISAGHMRHTGKLYFFVLKNGAPHDNP